MRTYFTKRNVLWACAIVLVIWVTSTILLNDSVERSELPDDSVIAVLEEGDYRFKIPVDYLYETLVEHEHVKEQYGIQRKFKTVSHVNYFNIYATYPDMTPVNLAEDKPGRGNKIMISLGVENKSVPLRQSAAVRISANYPNTGIIPEDFDSNEIIKYEGDSSSNFDRYFYKHDLIYMYCRKENTPTTPPFPSCRVYSSYKDLELTYSFSVDYKIEFIKIDTLIHELFESFELQSKEI